MKQKQTMNLLLLVGVGIGALWLWQKSKGEEMVKGIATPIPEGEPLLCPGGYKLVSGVAGFGCVPIPGSAEISSFSSFTNYGLSG